MKTCAKCKQKQPLSNFTGYQNWCKDCKRAFNQKRHSKTGPVKRQQRKMYEQKCRAENSILLYNYLIKHPCVDCGEADPRAKQFDHVHGKKKFNIAKRGLAYPWATVQAEIAKCEVRCASCHQVKTAVQRSFWAANYYAQFGEEQISKEAAVGLMEAYEKTKKLEDSKLRDMAKDTGHALRKESEREDLV